MFVPKVKTRKKTVSPKISLRDFRVIVKKEANRNLPYFGFNSWFDLWHCHIDWYGQGMLSKLHRRIQLHALFYVMRKIHKYIQHNKTRYQIFTVVYEKHSENDAVYIHTENLNGTPFPCDLKVDIWLQKTPFWLERYISLENYIIGESLYEGKKTYIIQKKPLFQN
jgi:hypothetical protein